MKLHRQLCQHEDCQNDIHKNGPLCVEHGCYLCGRLPEQPEDVWPVRICQRCRQDICEGVLTYNSMQHNLRLLLNQAYENGRQSVLGVLDPKDER